jgi:hypothetical protein
MDIEDSRIIIDILNEISLSTSVILISDASRSAYSNEKIRLSIFPFQAILYRLLQHLTDFHRAGQTLREAVQYCTG